MEAGHFAGVEEHPGFGYKEGARAGCRILELPEHKERFSSSEVQHPARRNFFLKSRG